MSLTGRFVWHELMTTDPDAAKAFYTAVTGWTLQESEGPTDYTMWAAPGGAIGGLMELPAEARKMGAPPHWIGYVDVPDVAATTARAEALGARVLVPPTDIPGTGQFSTLMDPQGAVISPFHSASTNWEPPTGRGTIAWNELYCDDLDAAFAFYAELFGWVKTDAMDMGPMGTYQMVGVADGPQLGGMMKAPEGMPPGWLYYCGVTDVDAAAAVVSAKGGQIMNGPMDVPGGDRIVMFIDPQGAMFCAHETKKG